MSDQSLSTAQFSARADVRGGHADVIEGLRSRVRRMVAIGVAVVAVVGVAGILVIAAQPSWAIVVSICVLVAGVGVVWAVGSGVATELRSHSVPPEPVEPIESEHSMFGDSADRRREVFGKLAHRLQSLINRAIQRVDSLEREIEDPDLLRGLYDIDHLATRVRRQAENLAVLGGGAPQRRSNAPVSVYAVMRSAVAEIEHYKQVTIVPFTGANLHGHAVAEVIHLLAELLENATTFTAPDAPKVVLRAHKVTAGLAIEIQDRGLGMTGADLDRTNRQLDGSAAIDLADLLSDGRIGLAVVKELSRRHNTRVRLQINIFGGIDAAVVLPASLLADTSSGTGRFAQPAPEPAQARAAPAPQNAPQTMRRDAPSAIPAAGRLSHDPVSAMNQPPSRPVVGAEAAGARFGSTPDGDRVMASPSHTPSGLPVRTPAPAGTDVRPPFTDQGGADPVGEPGRPPLPHRRERGSYLRPELQETPNLTRPLPGHDPNLLASVQKGFERVRDEAAAAEPSEPQPGTTRGETTAWPTT